MTRSALYRGHISHRRLDPVEHSFRYRVQMALLDLDELPGAFDRHPLWSARRPAPVRFRRSDHLGDPRIPLADSARALVAERTGHRPTGPVSLLTTPRFWGLGFNPVSFYFLAGRDRVSLDAVIAEVTNTPWGERHAYVLDGRGQDGPLEGSFTKSLHVSPFMPMEQTYRWRVSEPGEAIGVSIASEQEGVKVFEASLGLRRHPLTRREMTRALVTHPPAAAATLGRIYWNAVKLKLKGAPYHPRPAAS